MANLTHEGLRMVSDAATRHGFSLDAALSLVEALVAGRGTQAQFNHPDFGGLGQWSRGGMIMIADMFNQGLKYRVDALCNELSSLLGQQTAMFTPAHSSQSQSQGGGYALFLNGPSSWWPAELGEPSSTGAQNDMRYAFFPGSRRLAIQRGNQTQIYDSGEHQFSGFSQQQGSGQSLTFSSRHGTVRVTDLPLVSDRNDGRELAEGGTVADFAAPQSLQPEARKAQASSAPSYPTAASSVVSSAPPGPASDVGTVTRTLRELAALRQEGILTDEEFAAKKAELLSRI